MGCVLEMKHFEESSLSLGELSRQSFDLRHTFTTQSNIRPDFAFSSAECSFDVSVTRLGLERIWQQDCSSLWAMNMYMNFMHVVFGC